MLKGNILAVDNNFVATVTTNSQMTLSQNLKYRWGCVLQLWLSFCQIHTNQWENTPAL